MRQPPAGRRLDGDDGHLPVSVELLGPARRSRLALPLLPYQACRILTVNNRCSTIDVDASYAMNESSLFIIEV
jgi:hypothetical protein